MKSLHIAEKAAEFVLRDDTDDDPSEFVTMIPVTEQKPLVRRKRKSRSKPFTWRRTLLQIGELAFANAMLAFYMRAPRYEFVLRVFLFFALTGAVHKMWTAGHALGRMLFGKCENGIFRAFVVQSPPDVMWVCSACSYGVMSLSFCAFWGMALVILLTGQRSSFLYVPITVSMVLATLSRTTSRAYYFKIGAGIKVE